VNLKTKHIIIIFCVLLAISSTQKNYAGAATLRSSYVVDACLQEDKREVILSVNIGKVSIKDSLYGFDLMLKFEKGKLRFTQALTTNTLFEGCAYNFPTFDDTSANVQCLIGTATSVPAFGNKALIALLGYYTDDCPDSVKVDIQWLDPVTGYKGTIDTLNGTYVYAQIKSKENRYLKAGVEENNITINRKDSTFTVKSFIETDESNDLRIESIKLQVSGISNKYEIKNVVTEDNSLEIIKIEQNEELYTLTFKVNEIKSKYNFEMILLSKVNEDNEETVVLAPFNVNDCACITSFISDSVSIAQKKDTSTTNVVNDDGKDEYRINSIVSEDDEITIETENTIEDINIYNINGDEMKPVKFINTHSVTIDLKGMNTGTYFCIIRNINKEINKIMLIKN